MRTVVGTEAVATRELWPRNARLYRDFPGAAHRCASASRCTASGTQDARSRCRFPEHPLEDGVDLLEMIAEVEVFLELGRAQVLAHVLVGLEQREKVAFPLPDPHGVALHQTIGIFAREPLAGERDHHPLGVH